MDYTSVLASAPGLIALGYSAFNYLRRTGPPPPEPVVIEDHMEDNDEDDAQRPLRARPNYRRVKAKRRPGVNRRTGQSRRTTRPVSALLRNHEFIPS
jgi:hypothetical protein